jgi:membrane fusion protein, multidrug efflux system
MPARSSKNVKQLLLVRVSILRDTVQVRLNWYWLVATLLLLGALLGLTACGSVLGGEDVPTFVPPTPRPRETAVVERRPIEEWVEARGYVASENEEELYFPVGGFLKTVEAKAGQRIQSGYLLAELDAWDLEWTLARAQRDLQIMELRHGAGEKLSTAEEQVYELQLDYQQFYTDRLAERFERTRLVAPFDGVIYSLELKPGSRVEPYETIGVLVDSEELMVKVLVPDAYRGEVIAGMPVSVTLHVAPTVSWPAQVLEVSTSTSSGQGGGSFETLIGFTSEQTVPASYQMACTARVLVNTGPDALFLPAGALDWEGTQAFVDVKENGDTVRQEVRVGQRIGDSVEITSGVSEGQVIFLSTD